MDAIAKMPTYEAYKDSEVEWLGEVPDDWELKPMKYLVDIRNGLDHKHVLSDNGYPVYGSGGQFAFATGYLFDGEAILLGRKGTIDRPLHVKEKFWTVDTMFYAVPKPFVNGRFFYYCCTSIPFTYYSTSTALPSMTQADLNGHLVAWPSYEVQCAVANFLDQKTAQIDEAIAIKEQQIALLKERKQIIIQKAVTQGLDPDAPMKDSGVDWIGEIPAHWEVRRSKFLFTQRKERAWKDDVQLSATQAYGVIPQDQYEELTGKRVVKIQFHLDKRKHVEKDDFVISMRSFQGGLERAWARGCIRSSYVVLRALDEIHPAFYGYLLKLPSYIAALQQTASFIRDGQDLNFENFSQVDLFLPPLEEQREIADYVTAFMDSSDKGIELLNLQITKLKEYKTTLINSAVTGKIRITPEMVA